MKVEIPIVTRCCFCLPLRKGILSCSYIKLALTLITTVLYTNVMTFSLMMGGFRATWDTFFLIFIFLFLITDLVFTLVLIVGGHTKGYKMLQICMYYGLVNITIQIIIMILQASHVAMSRYLRNQTRHMVAVVSINMTYILWSGYILLLIRSEVKKLRNELIKIEFVNNAAESQCAMIHDNYNKA